ncbi:MAG: OmpA family protein [Spirochaetaceae bacterium]|jgi:ribosomal protein S13|nr:OmpA family protein [Spirochaetaceae bacterium]
MKKSKLVYCLIALVCACFVDCENPIMKKWWVEPQPKTPEVDYVPIVKMIPQISYETIIEHDVIYKTVYEQLPPQVIHDVVYEQLPPQVIERIVYEQLPPQMVYVQLPPQVIERIVYEQLPPQMIHDVVYIQLPPEVVYVQLPPQVIHDVVYVQLPPEVIYVQLPPEVIYETVIKYEVIHDQVPPEIITKWPSDDELLEYIKTKPGLVEEVIKGIPPEEIVKYLTDEQLRTIIQYLIDNNTLTDSQIREIIKQISPEEIVKYLTDEQLQTIIQYLIDNNVLTEVQIREIIKQIPPKEIVNYLTDEQIREIIKLQPPQVILQTIQIIDIEYIIFAGNADKYNGPHGSGASTDLTAQEKSSNDASVSAMAQALKDHPDYLIMLHGHANPSTFTDGETLELKKLSEDRAKAVEAELKTKFKALNGGTDIDNSRMSVSGYGGEKNLFGSNSTYAGLNRRVEMILVKVGI